MSKEYRNDKMASVNDEINIAYDILNNLQNEGLKDFAQVDIDFNFTSNSQGKLESLKKNLSDEFLFDTDYLKKTSLLKSDYELSVNFKKIIVTEELLVYLIIYLYRTCSRHDCALGDWGAFIDNDNIFDFSSIDVKKYMDDGYGYYNKGHLYKAFQSFTLITNKEINSEAYYNIGCLKYEFNILSESIKSYDNAIKYDLSGNTSAYLNRGVAYYDLGKYNEAIRDYTYVMEKEPENPDPYINIANAYVELKNKDRALDFYDKAIALGSEDAKKAKEHGLGKL